MKHRRPLSPPLSAIKHKLFGVSPELIGAVLNNEVSFRIATAVKQSPEWQEYQNMGSGAALEEVVVSNEPLPPVLQSLIARRIEARNFYKNKAKSIPESGQIVEVSQIQTPKEKQLDWFIQAPLYVLLDEPAEIESVWHGWLVSSEADYATWWDFVLQEEDEPFTPEASMVQIWNPVRIYLPMADQVVAQLTATRLQAVRSLAGEYVTGSLPELIPVWPGKVAQRRTQEGFSVVTGSPLGGQSDPRHEYRHFYHYAAEAVQEPARLALLESERVPSELANLLERILGSVKEIGASLWPVPQISLAMGQEDVQNDLVWGKDGEQYAKVRFELLEAPAGRVTITALSEHPVTAKIMVADNVENLVIAKPESDSVALYWDKKPATHLLLAVDNEQIELSLIDLA